MRIVGSFDSIVIGLGAMGSAAAYHLASRGQRVLGLEQFRLGHDRGSSHGETRLIRKAYFEDPAYVPLLQRAYELWDELAAASGEELLVRSGLVLFGRPGSSQVYEGTLRSGRSHGIPVEALPEEEARRRWPHFRPSEGAAAAFEPGAGYLHAERAVLAHARLARAAGAELHEEEPVLSWESEGDGLLVRTPAGEYRARRLVIAGGGWSSALLRELQLPLTLRKMLLAWFPASSAHEGAPGFVFDSGNDFFYGFPRIDGRSIKIASHYRYEPLGRPEEKDSGPPAPERVEALRAFVRTCLPEASPELLRHAHCIYTMTPDENFVIDRHPHDPRIAFAAGFSGHGFKFASAVGEILADLALDGATRHPIAFLASDRFGR